jgi:hypothetical protein
MSRPKFLPNEFIEDITAKRLREYEAKVGEPVTLPVPVEQIVEQVLGLDFDYDEIEEMPGEQILGGLDAVGKTIFINTKHNDLFEKTPGLLRSTIGHGAGHWDVDIDRSRLNHPTFPGFDTKPAVVHRHAKKGDRTIEVLMRKAMTDDRAYKLLKKITEGQDAPEVKSAVDRYQSALQMPLWLVREAAERFDLTKWPQLYRLAEEAEVTISNLVVRLQRLEMIFIPEGTKTIYKSKDEFTGQGSLF